MAKRAKTWAGKSRGPRPRKKRRAPDELIVPQDNVAYTVDPAEAGMRLDLFLKRKLKWRSRQKVQELIAEREITANGVRVDRAYRIKTGEKIAIPLPPPPEDAFRIDEIPLEILHEDDDLIVVNKQPGIVVHPVGSHRFNTLINALHQRYRDLTDAKNDVVPKLAHRLDRDTSGVLVAVKSGRHDRGAPVVFQNADVRKEYLAIAEGVLADDEGEIDLPIGPDTDLDAGYTRRKVTPGGQPARTGYRVVERFKSFTLVQLRLFTGRQHQIRVHLAALEHPVVCDRAYGLREALLLSDVRPVGDGESNERLLDRQALHAWRITFAHPATGEDATYEAPLAADMARALEAMRSA